MDFYIININRTRILLYENKLPCLISAIYYGMSKNVTEAQEGICITLDSSQATFISPESLIIALKGGDL